MFLDDIIPMLAGVYYIKCNVNNKVYIGSTYNLHKRIEELNREVKGGFHRVGDINKDVLRYGFENFKIGYVATCNLEVSRIMEDYYIEKVGAVKFGYNSRREGRKLLREKYTYNYKRYDYDIDKKLRYILSVLIKEEFEFKGKIECVYNLEDLINRFSRVEKLSIINNNIYYLYDMLNKLDVTLYIKIQENEFIKINWRRWNRILFPSILTQRTSPHEDVLKYRFFSKSFEPSKYYIVMYKHKTEEYILEDAFVEKKEIIDLSNIEI